MTKSFAKCEKCGKKGRYIIYGYLGNLPTGSSRCRYCGAIWTPKTKEIDNAK